MALAVADSAKWILFGNKSLYSSLAKRHYSLNRQDIATQRLFLSKGLYSNKLNRIRISKRNLNRLERYKQRYGVNRSLVIPSNRRNLATMIYV